NSNVSFVQGDMFNLTEHYGRFDVVYSGGVLEHLDETETIKLLSEQSKVAKLVLTVIPTKSEKQKAPILRFPYGIKELVSFGEKAGLKPYSVLLFKGIESSQCHRLTKHKDLDVFIQSLDLIPAQRIGVVFKSPMIKSITI
ncbi:class I SAM-dependent methyltransferase, partial [Microgenomates group bacterium]|nr:class I SAM-dependent methyltransferase [Microgenomates group bacterium]